MKTVLITGSEGNLGHYLVKRVKKSQPDWKVLRIKHGNGECSYDEKSGRYLGDLRDSSMLKKIFTDHRVDYVIHAASQSYSHDGYSKYPFQVVENDGISLLNLLRHSQAVSKFIYISSALVYEHADFTPLREQDVERIPAPTSSYGAVKNFGEHAVRAFGLENNIKYTIWRPFNIVSPREPHDGDGRHVFVDFFRRLLIEHVDEFRIFGSGEQVRCFLWVEDAAHCIINSIEMEDSNNITLNLARNEQITLLQLKDLLLELGRKVGAVPEGYNPRIVSHGIFSGVESGARIPSVEQLKELLRWESTTTVRDCFDKFIREKLAI